MPANPVYPTSASFSTTTDGTIVAETRTDAHGGYLFPDLDAGSYFVRLDETTLPDSDGNSGTVDMVQTPNPINQNADFGNQDQTTESMTMATRSLSGRAGKPDRRLWLQLASE